MNPTISIIIPVYNAEPYLHRCVESILSQTFADFELLLIDDGSPDKSGAICDEYAEIDERIRVFHKENGGVSSARNIGLDNATGEWVTFIDSDDLLPNTMVFKTAASYNADMIIFSYIENYNKHNKIIEVIDEEVNTARGKNRILEKYLDSGILKCICSKFIKRELIGDVRFDTNIRLGEDTLFIFQCLNNAQSFSLNSLPAYEYVTSDETNFNKYIQTIEKSIYAIKQIFEEYERMNVTVPMFEYHLFWSFKSVCDNDISNRPEIWFNAPLIKHIFKRIKKCTPLKQQLYYYIESKRLLMILYCSIFKATK